MCELSDEQRKAIGALKRVAKRWPRGLWLFSASGSLCIMRYREDGTVAMTESGGIDPDYMVAEILGIPNSGGDW